MKAPQRSRSLQIYVKPGIREDDLLIDVWEACARFDRPQDVFRTMLRRGLRAMVETGDMPKAVRDTCGLDAIIEKRRPRNRQEQVEAAPTPYPYPPAYPPFPQPGYLPYPPPTYPPHAYPPQADPAPWREEPRHRQQDHDHDRATSEPAGSAYDDQRPVETVRRSPEEKTPSEPPKAAPAPLSEKRPGQSEMKQTEASEPRPEGVSYGKGKNKLGNLM